MKNIIKRIAKNNGVSENAVRKDIQHAIREGMKNRNNTAKTKAFWDKLSPDGKEPSIEEFILACSRMTNHLI